MHSSIPQAKEVTMQSASRQISSLIEHFRLESLNEQTRCFYCGGLHRTVECESAKREAFHLSLAAIAEENRDEGIEQAERSSDHSLLRKDDISELSGLSQEMA
mgnify:CR=1 FL=1